MTRQTLSDPFVLSIICSYHQDEIISGGIIKMKQVCDQAQKPEASSKDDQLILRAQFGEDVLLVLLVGSYQPNWF